MSEIVDIRKTKSSENFNNKAKLMGLSKEKQVEVLNEQYKGLVRFNLDKVYLEDREVISLYYVNEKVRILELPEVEDLQLYGVALRGNNVITLKLPKTIDKLAWFNLSPFQHLKNLWIWDNTEIIGEKPAYSTIDRIFIQSREGKKTQVIKV